jgi:hypothetical protein
MPTPLFKKLQLKTGSDIVAINSPVSFEHELAQASKTTAVHKKPVNEITFAIIFVIKEVEIKQYYNSIVKQISDDTVLWFCYPKKTSKNYKSTINRDAGWDFLQQKNLTTVRAVAIDCDWSALRFRPVHLVKKAAEK